MAERWTVHVSPDAEADLQAIADDKTSGGKRRVVTIINDIETILAYEPFVKTRRKEPYRKIPEDLKHLGVPIWKLYSYEYRVSYALDGAESVLLLLALEVYHKGRLTTDEARLKMKRRRRR